MAIPAPNLAMSLDSQPKIPENIPLKIKEATGFFLEHTIAGLLECNGWQVIHNRFYLDDANPLQREMDIIAYKVNEAHQVDVYTTLIISCKKSVDNHWLFLTRKSSGTLNNITPFPLANYSNDPGLIYQMRKNNWYGELKNKDQKYKFLREESNNGEIIFAFREYNVKKSNIANDSAIYESINTLLKSQSYELNSLIEGRKSKPSYYSFNLISVSDVISMLKVHCEGEEITTEHIDKINYINRFIIRQAVNNSVINFVSLNAFENKLKEYSKLHRHNTKLIESELDEFYKVNLFSDYTAKKLIYDRAKESLIGDLHFYFAIELNGFNYYEYDDIKDLYLESNNKDKTFYFSIRRNNRQLLNVLNGNDEVQTIVSTWFLSNLYYKGPFYFEIDEHPF